MLFFGNTELHLENYLEKKIFFDSNLLLLLFVWRLFHGLTGDIERDRRADAAVLSLMAGEGGTVVVINRFHTHAALALLIFILQLDSGAVSQPDQLLFGFTRGVLLANQRHNLIHLDLYNAIAVGSRVSLDFYTWRKTQWLKRLCQDTLRWPKIKTKLIAAKKVSGLPNVGALMLRSKWRRSPNVNFILLFQETNLKKSKTFSPGV